MQALKAFWTWLGLSIGLIEQEYHHIVANFHPAASDLEDFVERKKQEGADVANRMSALSQQASDISAAKAKAERVAGKLRDLVA